MSELATFQRAFGRALLDDAVATGTFSTPGLLVALRIHRNTATKGLVDALAANYPTVLQLAGEEWFNACAIEYIRAHPARSPVLALYGEGFPFFLSNFAPAAELPYLADVARIDRMWVEAHTAPDEEALRAGALSRLQASALANEHVALHPATRFGWVRHSAATIWIHHRGPDALTPLNVDASDEGILLTRPGGAVEHKRLDYGEFTFLQSLSNGATLGSAAEAALIADSHADIPHLLAHCLTAGAFIPAPGVPS